MAPLNVIISILIGYLMGSISFARIVARRVNPEADISKDLRPIPNSDLVYEDDAVSATMVNLHVGWQYGCFTSILDMIKAIVPMIGFRLLYPEQPYDLIVSAAAMIGHNWPIFHHFKGGRGESVVYGSMLIIDSIGAVVSNIVALVLGLIIGQVNVVRWSGMVLLIPWLWWRTNDPGTIIYIIIVNLIFVIAMRKDFKQYYQIYKEGAFQSQADWSDLLDMPSDLGRFMDKYSLTALYKYLSP